MAKSFQKFLATLDQAMESVAVKTGIDIIPEEMTFIQWCEDLARRGMRVDERPFTLENRPALIPIYDAIPTTAEEAKGKILVIMKSAQIGLTVWEVLACIYMAIKFSPIAVGMFMPDQSSASNKSNLKFMRVLRSVPELYNKLIYMDGKKIGEGNVLTRVMGRSVFLFLWTSGKLTTESRPMDVVTLDEVQGMELEQIDKVRARMGASSIGLMLLLSTANIHGMDIDYWYSLGTQEVWHTRCHICGELSDLSDPAIFPHKTIVFKDAEYHFSCPLCGGLINNPQHGECVAKRPDAPFRSFLLPRTISPEETPRNLFESWSRCKTGNQRKSFYNRVLARPYVDQDQVPITLAILDARVRDGVSAGVIWKQSGTGTYMGIDQMGGFNTVIIKERLKDGRQAVSHVEAIFDINPFERCAVLMDQYGVEVCVLENLPNFNDARRFANRFLGRVFVASYADLRDDAMQWGDTIDRSLLKTSEEDRSRYTVSLHQYRCMQASLARITEGVCLFPAEPLEQVVFENGKQRRVDILRDWVFLHLTKIGLVVEENKDTHQLKPKVAKLGMDPHFAFSNMLCDVAWARNQGGSVMYFPPPPGISSIRETTQDTCGGCKNLEGNTCNIHLFLVKKENKACEYFL